MSALLKLLPVAAAAGVAVMNADSLKKNLNVIGKFQVAATSGVEMQGIAEAVAQDFIETKDLPVEKFGEFLKENMREKGGKESRDRSKDPWGTAYRLSVDVPKNGFTVQSAGPDKTWKTDDDLNYFYSLTGIVGKNAISAELASRAHAAASRQGMNTGTGTAGLAGPGKPTSATIKANLPPPKPSQSAEETLRKVIDSQTKRAEAGDPQAAFDLAVRYITENGVLKDYSEAKKLLEIAVSNADSQTLKEKAQNKLDQLNQVLGK